LRLREGEFDLKRVESDFETNRRRFSRLVGMAELAEDALPDDIPRPNYSEPQAAAMAAMVLRDNARGTLEFEYWDIRLREAVLGQKIAATGLLPKFGASANHQLQNSTSVNGNAVQQSAITTDSISIGGSWPIFDGFATRAAKHHALLNKRSIEHQRTVKIEELLESVQTLQRRLKFDADQLEFVATRKGIAEDSQRIATAEANFGNIPKGTVDNARLAVLLANAKNLEARALYLNDWCEFVAVAANDPVLNNLPARYARGKK
jgi:outer membrane protein TolC